MKIIVHLLFFLTTLGTVHAADPRYIDSIIAVVEDDVITNHELTKEISLLREELAKKGRSLPQTAAVNSQVLELMINKSIMRQEAKNRGIKITDTQLNSTLQSMAAKNGMNLSQFRQALIQSGADYNTLREDVRDELAISRIRNGYALQNVQVTEQEVDDIIARTSSDTESTEFRLAHILIALPDGASSSQVAEASGQINAILDELKTGADFAQLASEKSAGSNALQGGDLGWRKMAQIPSLFSDFVPDMAVGDISQPLRSASGFHLVKLTDRKDSGQVLVEQTRARHILIKETELLNRQQAKQKLEDIRKQILQGEDFASLAEQYSDDTGSGGLGGDLGWFAPGQMVPEFDAVVANTDIGQTSEVFRTQFGWHVLQVLAKRTVDETEASKRDKIRQQLEAQKKEEVLELWQRRLRDQAFVKIINE